MTTSASRQARSARNALAEALGLGEPYPLRDLPVTAEPPVVAFGGAAAVGIGDSELTTAYRLLDQDGGPLAGGAEPEETGTGANLLIDTPAIKEDIRFTVRATRPSGRTAMLFETCEIKVGLDDSLGVAIVPPGPVPAVIDHGASIELEVTASQEGVTYRLVARPAGDQAAADDPGAIASDIVLSQDGAGTGGALRLTSIGLGDDVLVRVRAVKVFGGTKPTQTILLKAGAAIFVRPDSTLGVTAKPSIVDHGAKSAIQVDKAAKGVTYALHAKAIADLEFSRLDPPDPATLAVDTPDGPVHVLVPPDPAAWEEPPGFQPVGDALAGADGPLSLPVPALTADTMILVEARKQHGSGAGQFASAERLDQAAAVLVRPNPKPPLKLAASVVDGKLSAVRVLSGQPGVFYALTAGQTLGELYLHQQDPDNASLNKGIGAIAVSVDLVVAEGSPPAANSTSPPPLPVLDLDPIALPADISIQARRAMTGLKSDLGKVPVAAMPTAEVQPAAVPAGKSATVTIAQPVSGELYAISVDGRLVADPVKGGNAALSLDTGKLNPGMRVELWARSAKTDKDPVQVERVTPLGLAIG